MARKTTSIFSKLLIKFLMVMSIPLLVLLITYLYYSESHITNIIRSQAENSLDDDVNKIDALFQEYKQRILSIATDIEIIEILKNDKIDAETSKYAYTTLFAQIGSGQYNAQCHLISASGKVRLSTHIFPPEYDIRINNNEWDSHGILNIDSKGFSLSPVISIENHRTTESGKLIIISFIKQIKDADGTIVGYAIIDLYSDIIAEFINHATVLSEELLIDYSRYYAVSLLHPTIQGSLINFNLNNENLIIIEKEIPNTEFAIKIYADASPYKTSLASSMLLFLCAIIIGSIGAVIVSLVFTQSITNRFKALTESMKSVESGTLPIMLNDNSGIEEFDQLSLSFNMMILQLNELMELTREEEAKLAEAERKELESQLNPHFLFNTLNTIKALARLNGQDEIYTISIKLGKLLRASLNRKESDCTLRESLELAEGYLTIQKIRFKDKINYEIDADESILDVMTPRLIIQPLVENAIIHGLEPMTEPGLVKISIKDLDTHILISIQDNGVGFDTSELSKNPDSFLDGQHVGLYNVYRRLQLKYSNNLYFKLRSAHNEGTCIEIKLPKGDSTWHNTLQ